jgi:hypothetical protein
MIYRFNIVCHFDLQQVLIGFQHLMETKAVILIRLFLESFLSGDTKEFFLTDDTRHLWKCTKTLVRCPKVEYKISVDWSDIVRFVRCLKELESK